jgi:hypothetical protein
MKVRRDWYDLPEGVRQAVEHNTGPVYCKEITTASSA